MTDVSVIITALDEPYLDRTIEDIIEKSGTALKEIIVVDDFSKEQIKNSNAKVYRNSSRKGLIWGRNFAADKAVSDVIVSVDPHVKIISDNWLEPLLKKLEDNGKCIAYPKTYCLDPETWVEFNTEVPGYRTTWDWKMDFKWIKGASDTNESPAVAGHCFSFKKEWWDKCGRFDDKMTGWGGENIDFSLRTWLFGGSVEYVDCWVAHWFKKEFQYKVYPESLLMNKSRIAESLFGDYKENFYRAINRLPGSVDFGDIRDRIRVRIRNQERPFSWFLQKFKDVMPLIR